MTLLARKTPLPIRIDHPALFYGLLCINLIFMAFSKFYPSNDGPAHLYNVNLLTHLLKGDEILSTFFKINDMPIANWTGHLIMTGLRFFLPGWLTEKVFLMMYVAGMAFSFRYLVRVVNPGNMALSLLVFPFIHNFLFHNGFYNFSISLILVFTTIAYYLRASIAGRRPNIIVMTLLLTSAYYTNLLAFFFIGLALIAWLMVTGWWKIREAEDRQSAIKKTLFEGLMLLIVSLPGLISFGIFMLNIPFGHAHGGDLSIQEKIVWLLDARPLIVFDYLNESIITRQYFLGFVLLYVFSLPGAGKRDEPLRIRVRRANIMLIPAFAGLILFFATSNSSGAGMMSDRYILIIYIFILIWLGFRTEVKRPERIILFLFVLLHLWMLVFQHQKPMTRLARNAYTINACAEYIEPYSLVLPVNLSKSWIEPHFSNYLGIDKPMIILENYEAGVGWFPLQWNPDKMPVIKLGGQSGIPGVAWIIGYNFSQERPIDVVFIFGQMDKLGDPQWDTLNQILQNGYTLAYSSANDYARVYKIK